MERQRRVKTEEKTNVLEQKCLNVAADKRFLVCNPLSRKRYSSAYKPTDLAGDLFRRQIALPHFTCEDAGSRARCYLPGARERDAASTSARFNPAASAAVLGAAAFASASTSASFKYFLTRLAYRSVPS